MNSQNRQYKRFSKTLDAWLSNLSKTGRSRKQAVTVAVDSILVIFSMWAAYSLRFGMVFSDFYHTLHLFILMPLITVVLFMSLGIYRWVVRSSNESLLKQLAKACVASALILALLTYLIPPDRVNPRSLFVIYGMFLLVSTASVRFLWRAIFDFGSRGEPIAIYGAGDAGRQLLNALSQGGDYRPVMFLDDNTGIAGSTVGGMPVILGNAPETISNLQGMEVERVIMAMPSISASDYQEKVDAISAAGIAVQTIPSYAELVAGTANLAEVRDVSITDILGRSEVPPKAELLGRCVRSKSVLVTGGGGSIGSELCRQILAQQPSTLVIVDHSEENLYKITEELNKSIAERSGELGYSNIVFKPHLCSVTDETHIASILKEYKIQTVLHAAAYKHVPIIESFPEQGVRVNIFGTMTVLDAAIDAGVENFTLISTDKAVRPTNSMGATKRIAELVLQAKARLPDMKTRISMVRFGNVLGSSGSVVPKFMKQIENGGPITLTDPNITRYFMTIPEAAQLVLQASAIAKGGDVFVLDMGEPVRIEDLAIAMVKMSGKKLVSDTGNKNDIDIVVEGLRPGEKMFEELFLSDSFDTTEVSKVFVAEEAWLMWQELSLEITKLSQNLNPNLRPILKKQLLDLAFLRVRDTNIYGREKIETSISSVERRELVDPIQM